MSDHFEIIEDLKLMRSRFGKEWRETYNAAFKNYVKGNWREAEEGFNNIL